MTTSDSGGDLQEPLLERLADGLEPEHGDAGSTSRALIVRGAVLARRRQAQPVRRLARGGDGRMAVEHVERRRAVVAADVELAAAAAQQRRRSGPDAISRPRSMTAAGVACLLDLVEQVRGEEHRPALGDELADHRPELEDAARIEAVHRLVEDQQLGVGQQAAGDAEPLAHALRVALDAVVGPVAQPDARAARRRSARTSPGPRTAATITQVLAAGQVVVEVRLLDDRARRARAPRRGRSGTGRPRMRIVPASGRVSPSSIRISVVLPAPLWPRKPNAQPRGHAQVEVDHGGALAEASCVSPSVSMMFVCRRHGQDHGRRAASSAGASSGPRGRFASSPPRGGGPCSPCRRLGGRRRAATRPISYASTTACTRSRRPSFISTFETCVLTVASPTTSASAISALDIPRASSSSTSRSRSVSSDSASGRRPTGAGSRRPTRSSSWRVTAGRQQRVAGGDHPHGAHQLLRRDVLGDEAAGAGAQRLDDVLVEAERRQHQHAMVGQPLDRLDPVEVRHPDVHQDHVRAQSRARRSTASSRRRPRRRPPSRRSPRARRGSRRASAAGRRRSAGGACTQRSGSDRVHAVAPALAGGARGSGDRRTARPARASRRRPCRPVDRSPVRPSWTAPSAVVDDRDARARPGAYDRRHVGVLARRRAGSRS